MKYKVNKVCQTSSGGSHVTIYDADLELNSENRVRVFCPPGEEKNLSVQKAVKAIRKGAEKVLISRGYGATIRVSRILIYEVDFKPGKFEQYTIEELERLL